MGHRTTLEASHVFKEFNDTVYSLPATSIDSLPDHGFRPDDSFGAQHFQRLITYYFSLTILGAIQFFSLSSLVIVSSYHLSPSNVEYHDITTVAIPK